jgi:hypothetical protein
MVSNIKLKRVAAKTIVFGLFGLAMINPKFSSASTEQKVLLVVAAFAVFTVLIAYFNKPADKKLKDGLKPAAKKAWIPLVLLLVLHYPAVYTKVSDLLSKLNVAELIKNRPLIDTNLNLPTEVGVGIHTLVFALIYHFAVDKIVFK